MTYSKQRALELLGIRDKATPGPWQKVSGMANSHCFEDSILTSKYNNAVELEDCVAFSQDDDATFIAAAHDIADQLQAAVELIDWLREMIKDYRVKNSPIARTEKR